MNLYVGIDPGKTGAMAVLRNGIMAVEDYTANNWLNTLKEIAEDAFMHEVFVMIERQQAFPKQGTVSMFKLGQNYGRWVGVLDALDLPYGFVSAKQWQNYYLGSILKSGERKTTKAASLLCAKRLYPKLANQYLTRAKDHNRADSILIASYCQLVYEGSIVV